MTIKLTSGPLQGVKVLELGHVMAGPVISDALNPAEFYC
jgi:crotonobetainyl-CoA:carnitine CoA-transferase CaiB-like acyl-CoA transferase